MGLFDVVLRPLRSPTVTRRYPPNTAVPDRAHRGTPELQAERCGASADCAAVCPTAAIDVNDRGDGTAQWRLDYGLCVFCGRCIEACPGKAITATTEFELSARGRGDVIATYIVEKAHD